MSAPGLVSVHAVFAAQSCPTCGVVFALIAGLDQELRQTGQRFYCTNGHALHFDPPPRKPPAEPELEVPDFAELPPAPPPGPNDDLKPRFFNRFFGKNGYSENSYN